MIPQCRTRMLWNGFVPSMVRSSTSWMSEDDGAWHLIQSRTHNAANELLTLGGSGAQVAHDRAGNMTRLPSPTSPVPSSSPLACTYDAWNRLVEVSDATTRAVIATYGYDARNFRITATTSEGVRCFYYASNWQCIEERVSDVPCTVPLSTAPVALHRVWGLRYIDDLVLRDRDAANWDVSSTNFGLEERLYFLQDPNWNVTAVADSTGVIVERVSYTAYGVPTFHDALWQPRSGSAFDVTDLYTGRRRDPETELYHYRMRQYAPNLGRFLSRDPIGYIAGDVSLHRYVADRALVGVDPLGLEFGPGMAGPILDPTYLNRDPLAMLPWNTVGVDVTVQPNSGVSCGDVSSQVAAANRIWARCKIQFKLTACHKCSDAEAAAMRAVGANGQPRPGVWETASEANALRGKFSRSDLAGRALAALHPDEASAVYVDIVSSPGMPIGAGLGVTYPWHITILAGRQSTGSVLAHELGHQLGLGHTWWRPSNLMFPMAGSGWFDTLGNDQCDTARGSGLAKP